MKATKFGVETFQSEASNYLLCLHRQTLISSNSSHKIKVGNIKLFLYQLKDKRKEYIAIAGFTYVLFEQHDFETYLQTSFVSKSLVTNVSASPPKRTIMTGREHPPIMAATIPTQIITLSFLLANRNWNITRTRYWLKSWLCWCRCTYQAEKGNGYSVDGWDGLWWYPGTRFLPMVAPPPLTSMTRD